MTPKKRKKKRTNATSSTEAGEGDYDPESDVDEVVSPTSQLSTVHTPIPSPIPKDPPSPVLAQSNGSFDSSPPKNLSLSNGKDKDTKENKQDREKDEIKWEDSKKDELKDLQDMVTGEVNVDYGTKPTETRVSGLRKKRRMSERSRNSVKRTYCKQ